jgi:hypothetical protein
MAFSVAAFIWWRNVTAQTASESQFPGEQAADVIALCSFNMATDDELITTLKAKYGAESVGNSVEFHGGRKFVRVHNLPVQFAEAYDDAFGQGSYAEDIAMES